MHGKLRFWLHPVRMGAVVLVLATSLAAQPYPVGSEFQVSFDAFLTYRPVVAMRPDGGFVVAWQSDGSSGSDRSFLSVRLRRFTADGSALGEQLQVNTYTTSY